MNSFQMVFRDVSRAQDLNIAISILVLLALAFVAALWVRRLPSPGRRGAAAVLTVAGFFALAEIATRLLGPPQHPYLTHDAARMWRLRSNLNVDDANGLLITNRDGYRNRQDFDLTPPAGALRVLCLGDSWMYGFRVDQDASIPAVLAESLSRTWKGGPVEVMNGGVFGYGATQGLAALEAGLAWHPRVVVVGLFHNMNAQQAALPARSPWQRRVRDTLQSSQLYTWMRMHLTEPLRGLRGNRASDDLLIARLQEAYTGMVTTARAAGAECVFVNYRLPPEDWPAVHPVDSVAVHPPDQFEQVFESVARANNVPLVEVSYWTVSEGTRYVDLQADRNHPNPTGDRWIAERVADAIRQLTAKRP